MASRDLAGLLTGISGAQRPNPNMGSDEWRMAFGGQQAQNLGNAVGNVPTMFGGERNVNPQEAIQIGMGKLDQGNIEDLKTLARMQQMRGDLEGAARTAAKIQAMQDKEASALSLSNQAKAVIKGLPAKYAGLKGAIGKGNIEALNKGIEILGALPKEATIEIANLVNVSSGKSVKQIQLKNGVPHSTEGVRLTPKELEGHVVSKTVVKPSRALIDQRVSPTEEAQAAALALNLNDQRLMYETVQPEQEAARQKLETAQRVYTSIAKGAPSGTAVEIAAKWAGDIQSLYALTNKEAPQSILSAVNDASSLKQIGFEAMLPLIEAQQRGFTDKDREHAKTVLPGLSQSWQYNEMVADLDTISALKTQDQMRFATKRKNLTEITSSGSETLWSNYLNDLPLSKVEKTTRNGLTYDRLKPIRDNEDLSQYWVTERPKGFKVKNGTKVTELSMSDIRDTAKNHGISAREYLADLSEQGLLIDGVYK